MALLFLPGRRTHLGDIGPPWVQDVDNLKCERLLAETNVCIEDRRSHNERRAYKLLPREEPVRHELPGADGDRRFSVRHLPAPFFSLRRVREGSAATTSDQDTM